MAKISSVGFNASNRFGASSLGQSGRKKTGPRCAHKEWEPGVIAKLEILWNAKDDHGNPLYSVLQICAKLGFSKNSVVGKAHRLNLPARKSPIIRTGEPRPAKPDRRREALAGVTLPPLESAPVAVAPVAVRTVYSPYSQCQWPSGDRPVRFECSERPVGGKPYCAGHSAAAYVGTVWRRDDIHTPK